MKLNISKSMVVGITLVLTGPMVGHALQNPEYVSIHASSCAPANLGQAINFSATWNNRGIVNPNPLGSGRSFFTVCPVVLTDDGTAAPGTDIYVGVRYDARDSTNRIRCTAFRARTVDAGFVKTVSTTDASTGTGPFDGQIILSDVIVDGDSDFNALNNSVSLLCALVPRSGLTSIHQDHD